MADDTTNNPAPPDEGFLHSLATSFGLDPEAVKTAAKAFYEHPVEAAKSVGSEVVDELSGAGSAPLQTAKDIGRGVGAQLGVNPDAQKTAKKRFAQPGIGNKLAGAEEYISSGVPLVGGNLVKAEEQGAQGNLAGSAGTTIGTVAPFVTETEPVQAVKTHLAETGKNFVSSVKEGAKSAIEAKAPEGSLEAGFAKLGGKKVSDPETAPQGGHAGGGVASEEELNRPGRFVKVSRSGQLTDQGKTPDFNLRAGEVGYQVKPDGTATVIDGQETPTHKNAIQGYTKEVYPNPNPEYHQTLARRGQLPNQTVNLGEALGETGKYVGGLTEKPIPTPTPSEGVHVPPESTSGKYDNAIKAGGAIPGGIEQGDPEIDIPDMALFHDPTTGSTLYLPVDQVSSENIAAELKKSRAAFAEGEAKKAPQIEIKTDNNGIKWASDPNGVRVSIPNRIPEDEVQSYAAAQIADQAKMQAAVKANVPKKLPPQPRLPDSGQYAAIKTDDGSIYYDNAPEKQRTHVMLAKDLSIPAERIVSGGWLKDGDYEGSERSDAGRYGERARAKQSVETKRANREGTSKPIPTKLHQNATVVDNMQDPDTRFNAARHEAAHSVISEALNPGSVNSTAITNSGGVTDIEPPAGKTTVNQLTPDEIRNMIATNYAGGLSEPGGTTKKHVSGDQKAMAEVLAGRGTSEFLQAPELQAEARARVTALLADPAVQKQIDTLTTHITTKGKLSGDEVRAVLKKK